VRSRAEVRKVLELADSGFNASAIARATGVPRGTVRDWLAGNVPVPPGLRTACPRCSSHSTALPSLTLHAYAYLLGVYLGDGCLVRHPRGVFKLSVAFDSRYPIAVAECAAAMGLVMPGRRATSTPVPGWRMVRINSYSTHWTHLFPQHGRGPKHTRPIVLENWQKRIAELHPGRLIRGLIHSDGCRVSNRVRHPKKTYVYPRYMFSNRSQDIQKIFTDACDRLDISWRQDGPWNVSVARRESVAKLDRFVGPKR
jgi:hypothetical protein